MFPFVTVDASVAIPTSIPESWEPSPKYVTIPDPTGPTVPPVPTLIPPLAVTIPTESTLVTSSYVNTPDTPKFPVTVTPLADACALVAPPNCSVAASIPVKAVPLPTKLVAVQTPVT